MNIKKFTALALVFALALAGAGCRIKIGAPAAQTVIAAENIKSMALDGQGTLYLLTDGGLQSYALSGDKRLEYVFDKEALAEAQFRWIDRGTELIYTDFSPEKLIANGDVGLQFVGRYMTNDAGRDSDLFVIQDIADMNYTAAYFNEIQRDFSAKTPIVSGIGVAGTGIYLRLNRPYVDKAKFDGGIHYRFDGLVLDCAVPEGTIGAIEADESGDEVSFLVMDGGLRLEKDGETVHSFDHALPVAGFVSEGKVYAVYSDGKVTEFAPGGKEQELLDLGFKPKAGDINEPFLYEGRLYWFDGEGLKVSD